MNAVGEGYAYGDFPVSVSRKFYLLNFLLQTQAHGSGREGSFHRGVGDFTRTRNAKLDTDLAAISWQLVFVLFETMKNRGSTPRNVLFDVGKRQRGNLGF